MVCRCPEPVRMARCQNVCNQNLQAPDEPFVRWRVETVRDRICMETKNTRLRRNTRFRTDGREKEKQKQERGDGWRRQKRNDNLGKQAWRYGVRYGMSDGKQTLETRTSQLHISERLGYRGCGLPTPHRNVFEILEKRIRWRAQRQAPTSPALALHAHSARLPLRAAGPGRVEHARRGRPVCVAQSANPAGGLLISPWAADDDAGHYGARQSAD